MGFAKSATAVLGFMKSAANDRHRPMQSRTERGAPSSSPAPHESPRIAHTLTACTRCRSRKTRCDPGLPRCGPCERKNLHCEYFDQAKRTKIPRSYVVHLQHKVRDLERTLHELESDDLEPEPEELVRHGARVHIEEHDESKFLGPSSGIAITRLVMQLAKQFADSSSISDIVDSAQAEHVRNRFDEEKEKPTSKAYPHISDVAADDLPPRNLADRLVELFNLQVLAMYPFFHEPTFAQDVEDVYNGSQDPFQNFAVRMVAAISLQRTDTQWSGLADGWYLAALKYLEAAVKPMNVQTIQCCMLIGAYSLYTPTRTAVYYVIGLAVRLAQALGLSDEKTLSQPLQGKEPNAIEIDMRRRIFWSIINMDYGLAHSLGRPSCFATLQEHIDVKWYETVDDEFITAEGVEPGAPGSLKKWISIHFHKMRLHQLEIRRKLYQKKRDTPKDENDPWFHEMEAKITAWKNASPETDVGTGLNKAWFVGRYNTMIAMMFRPTPQIPRPTLKAAQRCYEAVISNIYMHQAQIKARNVDITWIFTQAIFMTINTILWTLSYSEIRVTHPKEEVQGHLDVALDCIKQAIERWPGVASAIELYENLIKACIKIYDKQGDVMITAGSPLEPENRSRTTSPAYQSVTPETSSITQVQAEHAHAHANANAHAHAHAHAQAQAQASGAEQNPGIASFEYMPQTSSQTPPPTRPNQLPNRMSLSPDVSASASTYTPLPAFPGYEPSFNRNQFANPLPSFPWNPAFTLPTSLPAYHPPPTTPSPLPLPLPDLTGEQQIPFASLLSYPPALADPAIPQQELPALSPRQRMELLQDLQTQGLGQIRDLVRESQAVFYPRGRGY